MLTKIRHYVTTDTLRNVYYGIFSSLLNYGSQIWGQYQNTHIKRIIKLQNKAIRVINFAKYREPVSKLYQKSDILKLQDSITMNNFLYMYDSLNRRLPTALTDKFTYLRDSHDHNTRKSDLKCVKLPTTRTLVYGIHSVDGQSTRAWNYFQVNCSSHKLHTLSRNVCKKILKSHFIDSYSLTVPT